MSTEKTNVTVIIPVHELNESTEKSLGVAIESINQQIVAPEAVLVVIPKGSEIKKTVSGIFPKNTVIDFRTLENDGDTDFCSQINFGVENTKTEWFSILEYDDEYSSIWFKNFAEYAAAYPEVGLFLPMIADVKLNSDGKEEYLGGTNEAVWANMFSDEMGILDTEALLRFQNFNTDGMVMKTEHIEEFGGFKSAIKLTFIYEFLLRMTSNGVRTMVIPKIGYKHLNLRDGSLFAEYRKEMDDTESKWWLQKAKKEYYWSEDRAITYKKETA